MEHYTHKFDTEFQTKFAEKLSLLRECHREGLISDLEYAVEVINLAKSA